MNERLSAKNEKGFSLLEIMVVVVIISILAAIAIPQLADSIKTANEGYTRGNLGTIRKALSVYYSDIEGVYPATLDALTAGRRYMPKIPTTRTGTCPDTSAVLAGSSPDNSGGWLYDNATGIVSVNCTSTDTKGKSWTAY